MSVQCLGYSNMSGDVLVCLLLIVELLLWNSLSVFKFTFQNKQKSYSLWRKNCKNVQNTLKLMKNTKL